MDSTNQEKSCEVPLILLLKRIHPHRQQNQFTKLEYNKIPTLE